ncbi:MAG TPA: TIGR03118 family protein [Opitutaceae bacterium]|nr:TIGR03118 family protein [Opitutaceae bacterium]
MNQHHLRKYIFAPAILALGIASVCSAGTNTFREIDLVSDISGRALRTDPNLVNPWGISAGPATPIWVSDAGKALATVYNTSGTPLPLVVSIPGSPFSEPTGQVFNSTTAFNGDRFIFANTNGSISGWRGALGTTAEIISPSDGGAYTGLALGTIGSDSYLYAADFKNNKIDVVGSTGAPSLTGGFVDPMVPMGFAPFNVQNLAGQIYVTYAKVGDDGEDEPGPGNGFVSVFDLNGNLLKRLATGGALNSPWGLAIAPAGFGNVGGNLLVGNFGDGTINAYDLMTGDFVDSLRDNWGNPIAIDGLWGIQFGNGGAGGDRDKLYFAAGIEDETHGLFGAITPVPEASTIYGGAALLGFCGAMFWKRRKAAKAKAAA